MVDQRAIREELLKEKDMLINQLKESGTGSQMSLRDSVAELSMVDNHPADLASEIFERSKDMSLREKHIYLLQQVEDAIRKIDAGNYGICESCGMSIPDDRLQAVPYTRFCYNCQQRDEEHDHPGERPVEEDVLEPPFVRDVVTDDAQGYDAEDFWQEVARHNKRPRIFEDGLEDEETGKVEGTDGISNEEYHRQLPD